MVKLHHSYQSFNTTPLGSWALQQKSRRYEPAAIKLARRTGTTLPVAQTIAELNGLGMGRKF